jgi:lysozyme family protein
MKFETLSNEYAALWSQLNIRDDWKARARTGAKRIISGRVEYEAVQQLTGVPWWMIGIIHALECGYRFDRHLHNGDPLTRRTTRVPANRPPNGDGPFTWRASACDALLMKNLDDVGEWTLPRVLYELERYNGFGYRQKSTNIASPYLWSGSTHYTAGKYIRDHVWSRTAVSEQIGAAPLIWALAEVLPEVRAIEDAVHADPSVDHIPTPPVRPTIHLPTLAKSRTLLGALTAAFGWIVERLTDAADIAPAAYERAGSLAASVEGMLRTAGAAVPGNLGTWAVVIGLALVIYARIDAHVKGKEG